MKKVFPITALAMMLFIFSFSANGQTDDNNSEEATYETPKPETPKWISDKGYWVIKGNKSTPRESTIYFYNTDDRLVYQEEIKGRKLKLKKNTLMKLKAALEEAVDSYEKGTWASRNEIVLQHLK